MTKEDITLLAFITAIIGSIIAIAAASVWSKKQIDKKTILRIKMLGRSINSADLPLFYLLVWLGVALGLPAIFTSLSNSLIWSVFIVGSVIGAPISAITLKVRGVRLLDHSVDELPPERPLLHYAYLATAVVSIFLLLAILIQPTPPSYTFSGETRAEYRPMNNPITDGRVEIPLQFHITPSDNFIEAVVCGCTWQRTDGDEFDLRGTVLADERVWRYADETEIDRTLGGSNLFVPDGVTPGTWKATCSDQLTSVGYVVRGIVIK